VFRKKLLNKAEENSKNLKNDLNLN